ncbi:glucoamylase family protein [Botrimarina sp.]|uniref:glucoamylase family protein n=1 Tax=Botrimarina sp. TaxID=2795802 RepID=UPI0032F059F1
MDRLRRASLTVLVLASLGVARPAAAADQQAFLDDLQRRTFDFFWETTPAENGLTPDRWPSDSPSSIAAVGFGLTGYLVGVERGWVDRAAASERVLATLRFFHDSPQSDDPQRAAGYRGFYYHFLGQESGLRWRRCELSSIDTALLMMGVLACGEYFDADDPREAEIRRLADTLYRRVEWDWMQPRAPLVAMGWKPEEGGFGRADYKGYNEAMFLYVLALGSPTHPVEPAAWDAYTSTYDWAEFYGQEHVNFAPLFGHQYTACWVDPRGLQDGYLRARGIDYFENSRRATLAQRAYAIANPAGWRGYGEDFWGLTACDGPANTELEINGEPRRFHSYWARGASAERVHDDGTVAPTAAGGSIPFAPDETLAALAAMRDRYGDRLYAQYGFRDAINPTFRDGGVKLSHGVVDPQTGWVADDYLGIDQGPILLMAENHRSGLVWELMKKSPAIRRGLTRAGFTAPWLGAGPPEAAPPTEGESP